MPGLPARKAAAPHLVRFIYPVEGSARQPSSAVRLPTQLIMAERETDMGGDSLQPTITSVEDLFDIQIRLATSMARTFRAIISPEEKRFIGKMPVADLAVHDG